MVRKLVGWFLGAFLMGAQPISVALDKPLMSLNPLLLAREVESQVVDLVFDRLVALDEKGGFVPQMLESWETIQGWTGHPAEAPPGPDLAGRHPHRG